MFVKRKKQPGLRNTPKSEKQQKTIYKQKRMFYNSAILQREEGNAMRGRQSSCSFTGHRPSKLPWGHDEQDPRCLALKQKIRDAVEAAIAEGMEHFICGMADGCDLYFGEIVLELKTKYPHITLEAAIPCPTQAEQWSSAQRARYQALLDRCDYETLVQQSYTPSCMQRRNRYMVDHSSLLIAAHNGLPGGTRYTIEYALHRGLEIVDIPIEE